MDQITARSVRVGMVVEDFRVESVSIDPSDGRVTMRGHTVGEYAIPTTLAMSGHEFVDVESLGDGEVCS